MTKKFNIHEWQANQIKQRLTEHTVNFTKDDMATLHNDGKDHTYIFKEDLNEQGFDDRFKKAMGGAGFSDEEQDDVMSRDIGDNKAVIDGRIIGEIFDLIRINDLDPEDVMEEVATEFDIAFEFGRASGMAKQAGTDAGFDMRGL